MHRTDRYSQHSSVIWSSLAKWLSDRPPSGATKGLNVFKKANTENKPCFVVDNFNLNCLD